MNSFSRIVYGNGRSIGKKNVLWNMIGSIAYSLTSVILLMVVTRVIGDEQGGIFSIAFTTGQVLLTIGYYEMRPFQVTDISQQYRFQDYFTVRVITCSVMALVSVVYVLFSGYTPEKAVVVFLLCLYKMFDGLGDVFEGAFQQQGHLHLSGKALTFRAVLSSVIFTVAVLFTKNLIFSCVMLLLSNVLAFLVFDIMLSKGMVQITFSKNYQMLKGLFLTCLPLCAGTFMATYIVNSSKYSIDRMLNSNYQAYYNIIFMPAFVINLCSGFIFKPLLTTMAEVWSKKDFKRFQNIVLKLSGCVVILTAVVLVFGWFLGIPVLSWLYGVDLTAYKLPMIIILLGGGFSAMNTFIYYALTVMRRQKRVFWGYLITFAFSWVLPPFFVGSMGLLGASIAYAVLIAILDIIFLTLFFVSFKGFVKAQNVQSEEENAE